MKRILAATAASAILLAPFCAAQTREKKADSDDFPTLVKTASESFQKGSYATAMVKLQAALDLAREALRKAVIEAMPAAPEGFKAVPQKAAVNPYAGTVLGAMAAPIEHKYTGPKGQRLDITIHVQSPMVKMLQMAMGFAGNQPDKEKIGYGKHEGLLDKQNGGKRLQLQIIVSGQHLITANANGMTEKQLFALIDQALVDKLAGILNN